MLVMIVTGTAAAHAVNGVLIRGVGSSSCREIMETLSDNQLGNGYLMTYATGFLSGVNGMAAVCGMLPPSDMADNVEIHAFVKMTRAECRAHSDITGHDAMSHVLLRLNAKAGTQENDGATPK